MLTAAKAPMRGWNCLDNSILQQTRCQPFSLAVCCLALLHADIMFYISSMFMCHSNISLPSCGGWLNRESGSPHSTQCNTTEHIPSWNSSTPSGNGYRHKRNSNPKLHSPHKTLNRNMYISQAAHQLMMPHAMPGKSRVRVYMIHYKRDQKHLVSKLALDAVFPC